MRLPSVRASAFGLVARVVAAWSLGVLLAVDRLCSRAGGAAVLVVRDLAPRTGRLRVAARAHGAPVRRLRTPVKERRPRVGETLIVVEPDVLEPDEARAIGAWVRSGGRLVASGRGDFGWLEEVLADPPVWTPNGPNGGARSSPSPRRPE